MRISAVVVILTVTFAQAMATVTFQTVTNNRIITPSIMGFESLFVLIQTGLVYFLGTRGLSGLGTTGQFLLQSAVMVGFAILLYSRLLSGRFGNLHIMLLVGIVIGTGLGSLCRRSCSACWIPTSSTYFERASSQTLAPAKVELPYAPICLAAGLGIWMPGRRLNVPRPRSQVLHIIT